MTRKQCFLLLVAVGVPLVIGAYFLIRHWPPAFFDPKPQPTVVIVTAYPGANAQTVVDNVAVPIEQQLLGMENLVATRQQLATMTEPALYLTFKPGTDPDMAAQVLVQNRVALAAARSSCGPERGDQRQ